jgi:hypothetical protein
MKNVVLFVTGMLFGLILSIWVPMPMSQNQIRKARQAELSRLESTFNQQLEALPGRFSTQVERLFPLELRNVEGSLQLTTPSLPSSLSSFLATLPTFGSATLPTVEKVVAWRKDIAEATNSLQPLQRLSFANEIALADWALNALDFLSSPDSDEELLVNLVIGNSLLDDVPASAPTSLVKMITQRSARLIGLATEQIREAATKTHLDDLGSLRSAAILAGWMSQENLQDDTLLADRLSLRIEAAEWLHQWRQTKPADLGSEEAYDMARYRLVEDGAAIIEHAAGLRIPLDPIFVGSLRQLREEMAMKQRKAYEQQHGQYQLWALAQIQAANEMIGKTGSENIAKWLDQAKKDPESPNLTLARMLKSEQAIHFGKELVEAVLSHKSTPSIGVEQDVTAQEKSFETSMRSSPVTGMSQKNKDIAIPIILKALGQPIGWKNHADMAKALTADALLSYLMVIDEAQLDRPVAALYSEAFQTAWNYLEGSDYRLEVAKAGAALSKKSPGDDLSI